MFNFRFNVFCCCMCSSPDVFTYWPRSSLRGMIHANSFNILYICCNSLTKVDVYACINHVIIPGFVHWNIFMIIRKLAIMTKNNNEHGIFALKVSGIISSNQLIEIKKWYNFIILNHDTCIYLPTSPIRLCLHKRRIIW